MPSASSTSTGVLTLRQRRAVRDQPRGGDRVRQRQRLGDCVHPAGQLVERHVDAAEDQQHRHRQVGDDRHVAHPQADRAGEHPEAGRGEGREQQEQRDRGHRRPRHAEAEQERAADEAGRRRHRSVDEHRERPAEEQRGTVRGRREHRRERLCPALAVDREAHPEQRRERRRLHRVADHEPRVRLEVGGAAEVGEEDDLRRRAEQQRRDVDRRADPREEGAEADRAADEEDAEPGSHVSESVARSRASRSKWWSSRAESAV